MKNVCKECMYYHPENNTCQSKKVATCGAGYVSWFDRLFCKPYKQTTFCYCDCGNELVKNHLRIVEKDGIVKYWCKCGKESWWDFYAPAPFRIK